MTAYVVAILLAAFALLFGSAITCDGRLSWVAAIAATTLSMSVLWWSWRRSSRAGRMVAVVVILVDLAMLADNTALLLGYYGYG